MHDKERNNKNWNKIFNYLLQISIFLWNYINYLYLIDELLIIFSRYLGNFNSELLKFKLLKFNLM